MRVVPWFACSLLILAIAACGRATSTPREAPPPTRQGATSTPPATPPAQEAPPAAGTDGAADEVEQARAYIAQFVTDDPDTCFGDVQLEQPTLEARRQGQPGPRVPPTRVIVAIDGSGSMAGKIGGQTKLQLARNAAVRFVDGLPPSVEASLLVFGQQGDNSQAGKARSCAGVDVLAPMSRDRASLGAAARKVRAVGWTPLAAGLDRAQSLLAASSTAGEQVIYVVSDGEETCGGDPVAAARRINSGSTRAIVNIIGFGLPSTEAAALKAVADAGGGDFVNIGSRADYDDTLERVREANRSAGNAVRASDVLSRNAVRTSDADRRAALCISNIISGESLRLSDDVSRRALRGEPLPYLRQALDLQQQRHQDLLARGAGFSERLKREEADVRKAIEAAAGTVR